MSQDARLPEELANTLSACAGLGLPLDEIPPALRTVFIILQELSFKVNSAPTRQSQLIHRLVVRSQGIMTIIRDGLAEHEDDDDIDMFLNNFDLLRELEKILVDVQPIIHQECRYSDHETYSVSTWEFNHNAIKDTFTSLHSSPFPAPNYNWEEDLSAALKFDEYAWMKELAAACERLAEPVSNQPEENHTGIPSIHSSIRSALRLVKVSDSFWDSNEAARMQTIGMMGSIYDLLAQTELGDLKAVDYGLSGTWNQMSSAVADILIETPAIVAFDRFGGIDQLPKQVGYTSSDSSVTLANSDVMPPYWGSGSSTEAAGYGYVRKPGDLTKTETPTPKRVYAVSSAAPRRPQSFVSSMTSTSRQDSDDPKCGYEDEHEVEDDTREAMRDHVEKKRKANTIAATKSRLRKVDLIAGLQGEIKNLTTERDDLTEENNRLRLRLQQSSRN